MSSPRTRFVALALVSAGLYLLYFHGLDAVGILSADEPRYASIGRAMALTGDFVTPRLWGEPWFEKPPLLYWMTAVAFRLGLSEHLAPRLPVACLSVAFLAFFAWRVRQEFGARAAAAATLVLGASAGWLAYSFVAVTDLPLAVFFGVAMLSAGAWLRGGDRRWLPAAGASLGMAMLAKGLVPLVLAACLAPAAGRRVTALLHPRFWLPLVAMAGPWYAACTLVNGRAFVDEFFLVHHFGRFSSEALQHVQPGWFYVPVLAGALFPWIPLAVLAGGRRQEGLSLFWLWLVWGFLFFSLSTNKLPGYLLPLLPAAAVLLGVAWDRAGQTRWPLAASVLLLGAAGPIAAILPEALATGLSRAAAPVWHPSWVLAVAAAGVVAALPKDRALAAAAVCAMAAICFLKTAALPALEASVSPRTLWREAAQSGDRPCMEPTVHRAWRYGLNYYAIVPLAECGEETAGRRIVPGQPRPRIE
ncbi:MAG: glycosyltransferase family 39 protein [Bryobacterales bacterium]|nr:glycosyltransferase family 39 protein [Bryobacterales bacterium]